MSKRTLAALASALALAGCSSKESNEKYEHVLLISVDGLHQVDLANWIAAHPSSTLAQLSATAVTYTAAKAPTPSDSFPGLLALVTGGSPKTTGVYYDDSYDRTLFPPGSRCAGSPGTEVVYDESVDYDMDQLFSGGINPENLPLALDANGNCNPVYPHDFLRVNTVFEVIKAAGGLTAWCDKHPAYDLVNGPSGSGVDDLFTPEINSQIVNGGTVLGVNLADAKSQCNGTTNSLGLTKVTDYTTCLPTVEAYDDVKVQAVINQIDGKRSTGAAGQGVPEIFGMNFQAVSVGQKLPVGGYTDAGGTPSAALAGALSHTDQSLGRIVSELKAKGLFASTLIVISAKHGQSPIDETKLAMEGGGHAPIQTVQDPIGFINNADPNVDVTVFTNTNTTGPTYGKTYSTQGHLQTDDLGILWLQDQSPANVSAVVTQLGDNAGAIFASTLPSGTIFSSNITSGAALASLFGDPTSSDPIAAARAPNVFIQPDAGVIYSGSSKKIAEHGGGTQDDTQVALLVSSPSIVAKKISTPVSTTQVAPSILKALKLDPSHLEAAQKEGTAALPDLF